MADARKEFQVRPGVDGAVDLSDGALRCDFAWRGVAGGTGEQWSISVDAKKKRCLVGRERESYLLFGGFEAKLGVKEADVVVFDGRFKELLRGTEYTVNSVNGSPVVASTTKGGAKQSVGGIEMSGV